MNNNNNTQSKYWQDWKLEQPGLNNHLKSVAIGMVLGDAGVKMHGKYAYLRFEQSRVQYGLIHNLFGLFKSYTFSPNIGVRFEKDSSTIKSFYFKTFTHPTFTELLKLFYNNNNIKDIQPGFVTKHVDDIALAYWIMCDGSLHKRDNVLTLHTENFTLEANTIIKDELNQKFGLHSTIGLSRRNNKIYYMIHIPRKDRDIIINLVSKYIINDMLYKINYF